MMEKKRGIRAFLYTILILLIVALFGVNFGPLTGLVTDLGNVLLQIQVDLRAPENLTIIVSDQSTGDATLNWTYSNAHGYYIWYSDNVTEILQLNYSDANLSALSNVSSPNVTLVGKYNTTWNDTSAGTVQKRFYAVAAYMNDGELFTTSDIKVGKWNWSIEGEDGSIGHSYLSTPLVQNVSINDVDFPNDFCAVYSIVDDNLYAFSFLGGWVGDLSKLEFGSSYYFDLFNTKSNLTTYGEIPTGNVTKYIASGNNYTSLGWESVSTNGSLSGLIQPSADFASVYGIDYTKSNEWTSSFYFMGSWIGDISQMEAGKGYLFGTFTNPENFTYERNPY